MERNREALWGQNRHTLPPYTPTNVCINTLTRALVLCVCLCVWGTLDHVFRYKTSHEKRKECSNEVASQINCLEKQDISLHIQRTVLISCLQNRLGNVSVSVWPFIVVFFTPYLFSFFTLIFRSVSSLLGTSDNKNSFSSPRLAFIVRPFNITVIGSASVLLICRHLQVRTDSPPFLRSR